MGAGDEVPPAGTLASSAAPAPGAPPGAPIVLWRFVDGRRGHDSQSAGLVAALRERVTLQCRDVAISPRRRWRDAWRVLVGAHPGNGPRPELLVGAGAATHLAMLAARRRWGGRIIVLMSPGLPRRLFDLCIVPDHDRVRAGANTLVSRGALNRMRPGRAQSPAVGLILLGGPSRHHGWDNQQIIACVRTIAAREPHVAWTVALSPRTPHRLVEALRAIDLPNVETVAFDAVDAAWLPNRLGTAATVWVSEDSVSMVYEAITAGAATGLLPVPARPGRRGPGQRAARRLQGLVEDRLVTTYDAWRGGRALRAPADVLDEANRCAQWIVDTWLRPPA